MPAAYALILDDHPLVARGVAEFLRSRLPGLDVVTVPDAPGLWQALADRQSAPDIALIDFWLADGAALDLIAQLRAQCPHTPLVVVSGDDDPGIAARVQAAGAQGFVHKQEPPETFARAVEALLGGMTWFLATPGAHAAARNRDLPVTPVELGLSTRQGEILALVLQGLPNKRIALQYNLSESTVKEHMSAILQRLGARTRVEAITRLRGKRLVLPSADAD
ncbi:LuxR C-terminal-related transcriptional regulator [Paracidovorax sp. MALMAid1276]|uniref:LuxR C-terminal-related transcriptional regulator n=1 Tax=Paracidovorax sp. MALMAid1276 TaxID=3411631 RepID=UPI003B9C578C